MTYKKIAQIANVSLSTVSKALSGSKEISEELRSQIIQIAIAEGYFTEKRKRRIEYSVKAALTVAVICPEIISITYSDEITAIKNELEQLGATVAIYVYDFNAEKLNKIIENITIGNRADGIILFPMTGVQIKSSIPMVILDSDSTEYDTVNCDINAYFTDMIQYLQSLGHKSIAFVGEAFTKSKQIAYQDALKKCGMLYNENSVYIFNERFEEIGYQVAEALLQKNQLPDAVICAYDEIALALIHKLNEKGIEIPKQISIVGINDIPMSAYSLIPLTTVRLFQQEKAAIAVELLYDKIFGHTAIIQHIIIQHSLIIRSSTAKKEPLL